ncbi:MAG: nuclear transport factor 2 family protein [Rudaea sp.]|uniref:nuclear transport factor 2 family protein n=1 Tax=unclassified Rudaea TaxID=2627037 RepID=UPI00148581B7|nr:MULTISPECIES: nuclear transport factor 2 family protein [unclassified Rudaea]MBN8884905.1 nuclear transport factor 2 family protein [Rudaea sp.]
MKLQATLALSLALCSSFAAAADTANCAAAVVADQKKDEDTIRRIEQGWLTAEYRGNPKYLECLLEPDYRTSGRAGKVRTREDVISRVAQLTDMSKEVPKLETIVFIHGDAASAHSILRSTDKAGNPKEVHFVDSYTFHDGRWFAFSGADL